MNSNFLQEEAGDPDPGGDQGDGRQSQPGHLHAGHGKESAVQLVEVEITRQ